MEKLPIVRISGFDTLENVSFCYELTDPGTIEFTLGGFVEFEDSENAYQIPVEYIDRISVFLPEK